MPGFCYVPIDKLLIFSYDVLVLDTYTVKMYCRTAYQIGFNQYVYGDRRYIFPCACRENVDRLYQLYAEKALGAPNNENPTPHPIGEGFGFLFWRERRIAKK